jgi:hypothetical protein
MFKWGDPNAQEIHHSIGVGFDIASEMHIYALEWTPTQMRLYVDNVLKKTMNVSPNYPMLFLLGIYENAGWTGSVDPADPRPKDGSTGQYGFGLFDRRTLSVTQQGIINAIMSAVAG